MFPVGSFQSGMKSAHGSVRYPPRLPQDEDLVFLQRHDYDVSAEDRLYFERNGHVVTRELLTEKQLDAIRPHIQRGAEKCSRRFLFLSLA